jgi:hypothetical protein
VIFFFKFYVLLAVFCIPVALFVRLALCYNMHVFVCFWQFVPMCDFFYSVWFYVLLAVFCIPVGSMYYFLYLVFHLV